MRVATAMPAPKITAIVCAYNEERDIRRKLEECLASGRYAARVAQGVTDGAAIGVKGTPAFVVGKTMAGDFVQGTPIRGAQPLETFRRIIDQTLNEQ